MWKMNSIVPTFSNMSECDKLKTILCPKSTAAVKTINKFIKIMFIARDNISEGLAVNNYQTMPVNICYFNDDDYLNFTDIDEWELSLSEQNLSDLDND